MREGSKCFIKAIECTNITYTIFEWIPECENTKKTHLHNFEH